MDERGIVKPKIPDTVFPLPSSAIGYRPSIISVIFTIIMRLRFLGGCFLFYVATGCGNNDAPDGKQADKNDSTHSCMDMPARFAGADTQQLVTPGSLGVDGMVLIPGGRFSMGGDNEQASPDEFPKHTVWIDSFYMDITEVTNAQFRKFVEATGYITTAERKPDWEEMKKTLPPGTSKPPDEVMVASSLVFRQTDGPVSLNNPAQWWSWVSGANWKQPAGPGSSIVGKDNYPVVHISWDDAMAYCKWAGRRLPTEAEWEYASRGGLINNIYPWGNEHVNAGRPKANSWEGKFPYYNEQKDGFMKLAPVKSFAPNGYGLYDMAGNVWEWCADWYDHNYYKTLATGEHRNPQGPAKSFDPAEPAMPKRSMRGGSFLCNDSYCSGYRSARRMKSSPDSGFEHTGFRTVSSLRES